MEQDRAATTSAVQVEVVELHGGRIWELTTADGERVVVDRGFRPRGGDIRSRWRHAADEPWRRLFGVRPIDRDPGAALSQALGARRHRRSGRDRDRLPGHLAHRGSSCLRARARGARGVSMEHEERGRLDGVPIRVPADDAYRTCSVCGGDCEPDTAFGSDQDGVRIAFVCPKHGMQCLVDPFEHLR